MRGFNADWKRSIEAINQAVMQSFTNFKNGTAILQVWLVKRCGGRGEGLERAVFLITFPSLQLALGQLIQYYHRFQKILSQHPYKTLAIRSELINIHHIMVEIKKHKQAF